jgi:hypothetical protein
MVVTENAYRPELTFQVSFNGVHPANYGYWQMGAGAFAFSEGAGELIWSCPIQPTDARG